MYILQINKLQAAIKYGEDDLPGAKSLVENCPSDDPDTEVNLGCLLFKVSLAARCGDCYFHRHILYANC